MKVVLEPCETEETLKPMNQLSSMAFAASLPPVKMHCINNEVGELPLKHHLDFKSSTSQCNPGQCWRVQSQIVLKHSIAVIQINRIQSSYPNPSGW